MYEMFKNVFEDRFVKKAIEIVFNTYLNDDFTYQFFKDFPIKDVEKSLHSSFTELTNGRKANAKRELFKLGNFFYENNIPFTFMFDVISKVKLFIFKSGKNTCRENADELDELFSFVENSFSYGYLIPLMKQDKDWIRDELRALKKSDSLLKVYIKDHLIWLNKLIEDVRKLRKNPSVELNPYRCNFGHKLTSGVFDAILTGEYKRLIDKIHKDIHLSGRQIYFFLEKRMFKNLLIEYINNIKNVGRLLSTISLNFAITSESQSKIDPLTGLLNRRSMEMMLINQLSIAKIANTTFSIAIIDIDDFKKINDTFGHLVGDCVLRNVAHIIKESLRKSDFVFRYGGEEFVVLLPFTELEDAKRVMEKVRINIKKFTHKCEKIELKTTVSIGVAEYEDGINSINELLEIADKKLYIAKKTGKNKVVA